MQVIKIGQAKLIVIMQGCIINWTASHPFLPFRTPVYVPASVGQYMSISNNAEHLFYLNNVMGCCERKRANLIPFLYIYILFVIIAVCRMDLRHNDPLHIECSQSSPTY